MSFNITLSGINAINSQLDEISNNIANTATTGFKSSRANFASMYAGSQETGVEVASKTQNIETGGSLVTTGRSLDAAIQGRGFFVSRDTDGSVLYSRVGIFNVDKTGYLVNSDGRRVQGYAMTPGSTTLGAMGDLLIPNGQVAAQASSRVSYVGNLSADWTVPAVTPFDKTNPQTFNSSVVSTVYDSLGTQHTLTQYFVKTGSNQVDVHYAFDGSDLATTSTLSFGTDGQLTAPAAPVTVALGTPAGAAALSVDVNYLGTTQFAGQTTTSANSTDGYASGTFTGVALTEDGSIQAQYSNGQKQTVGMLALAGFPNEGGLTPVSGTSWEASSKSGAPLYSTPGAGLAGKLVTGSLEQSNVNMTSELVNLMAAQSNYQANSKVITAQNQMMQALMQAV